MDNIADKYLNKYFINDEFPDKIMYGKIDHYIKDDAFSIAIFNPTRGFKRALRTLVNSSNIDAWILCESLEELEFAIEFIQKYGITRLIEEFVDV